MSLKPPQQQQQQQKKGKEKTIPVRYAKVVLACRQNVRNLVVPTAAVTHKWAVPDGGHPTHRRDDDDDDVENRHKICPLIACQSFQWAGSCSFFSEKRISTPMIFMWEGRGVWTGPDTCPAINCFCCIHHGVPECVVFNKSVANTFSLLFQFRQSVPFSSLRHFYAIF